MCITFVIRKKQSFKVFTGDTVFLLETNRKIDDSNVTPTLFHLSADSILSNMLRNTPLDVLFLRQPRKVKEKWEEIN